MPDRVPFQAHASSMPHSLGHPIPVTGQMAHLGSAHSTSTVNVSAALTDHALGAIHWISDPIYALCCLVIWYVYIV